MDKHSAKLLFGANYLGLEEQLPFLRAIGLKDASVQEQPIQYRDSDLQKAASEGYILIHGTEHVDGRKITLRFLREQFGTNPNEKEPCFYNQDWYFHEDFIDRHLNAQWFLVKKDVFENSRAVMPLDLTNRGLIFPSAILCAYTFFVYYFAHGEYLWWHDFVWCCDVDHNGDRVYVGKYHDIDGVNKNGFSIHRHLALRNCYAAVNVM